MKKYKLLALQELREHLEELLLLIRLGKEVQAFKSFNAYSQVVDRRFDAAGLHTVLGQYRYFRSCFENEVLFFKVGRFIEFYHAADQSIAHYLGLQQLKPNRRGALWGFPVSLARHYLRLLLKAGWPVVCIVETGQYLSKIQERRVFCRVAPCYRMVGACDF